MPGAWGDANSIRQVWINLISNAIKYSQYTKQPRIEIGSYQKDGDDCYYVKDNGVGFDEQYSNKLFKVFQRLHSTEAIEGTGVGLAIVAELVAAMGACVHAESPVGPDRAPGTRMVVDLLPPQPTVGDPTATDRIPTGTS